MAAKIVAWVVILAPTLDHARVRHRRHIRFSLYT